MVNSREMDFETIFELNPDLSSGSNDIYFRDEEVIKILKPSAALYQFCTDRSPNAVLDLLESVYQSMIAAFGDMLVTTKYVVKQEKIITTQPRITGKTLKELGETTTQFPNPEALSQGIARLRAAWNRDPELLGYIIDEIVDPSNVIFDDEKLVIIDWL